MATHARRPVLRQIGYVSLMNVDQSADDAWKLSLGSTGSLRDFVDAMPLVANGSIRASLYDRLTPLVDGLPEPLADEKLNTVAGRYVRIELPKRGTLTLAEVEVMSNGVNVARSGKATQKNTAFGGDAQRAIDGNKSGTYGDNGQTHTEENTRNAWWEVDLGSDMPIESIVVYNRTDGYLGRRLNGFTVKVLDSNRQEAFIRVGNDAPRESLTLAVSDGDPARAVRHAAMMALTYVRGQEAKTFALVAPRVADDRDRMAAIRALQRIPAPTGRPTRCTRCSKP